MDNKELIDQLALFRKGHEDAFNQIYMTLKIPVYTIAYRITYNKELAEDIVQEIFMKLAQNPPPNTVKKPRAWVFKMTSNLAIDHLRKMKDGVEFTEENLSTIHSTKEFSALQLDVEQAIRRLNEQERQIVALRLNGEMTFKEIAEILNQPLGTILWRYQKAIKEIRKQIEGRSDDT